MLYNYIFGAGAAMRYFEFGFKLKVLSDVVMSHVELAGVMIGRDERCSIVLFCFFLSTDFNLNDLH
jgi:hypothetical protein